jgi:hypothetical protein
MNQCDGNSPLDKLLKCDRCDNRFPTDSEAGELCNRRKRESRERIKRGMANLERKDLPFCVCPERLWENKPHLVAAVLAVKYPKMNWESQARKNRNASWIIEQLAGNSNNKALTATERRRVYEFREKGSEILYQWGLQFPEVEVPLIAFLDNLMDNPLFDIGMLRPHTPAEMQKFLADVAQDPSLLIALLSAEITGCVPWPDRSPFGYDPDGMKKELYDEHPEYQAILDGIVDDFGYDECIAALANYGYSTNLDECNITDEDTDSESASAEYEIEMRKLRTK